MEDELSCGVCYEAFDDKERRPMAPPCGHSFCQSCMKDLQICPTCRDPIPEQPKVNFGMLEVISLAQKLKKQLAVKPKDEKMAEAPRGPKQVGLEGDGRRIKFFLLDNQTEEWQNRKFFKYCIWCSQERHMSASLLKELASKTAYPPTSSGLFCQECESLDVQFKLRSFLPYTIFFFDEQDDFRFASNPHLLKNLPAEMTEEIKLDVMAKRKAELDKKLQNNLQHLIKVIKEKTDECESSMRKTTTWYGAATMFPGETIELILPDATDHFRQHGWGVTIFRKHIVTGEIGYIEFENCIITKNKPYVVTKAYTPYVQTYHGY